MAIKDLSLKAIRDQINAGTREVSFKTDDGATAQMVYIPKFRIPAGTWGSGTFPAQDMNLGGFFIDKYQASHKAATHNSSGSTTNPTVAADSTTDVAVSLPGRVPWASLTFTNAKQACANRKINGVACHLVTAKEWATMVFLIKFLGHYIRGNNFWGRDYRDSDIFENYGVVDSTMAAYNATLGQAMSRILTGTGPVSFSHNGMANGVFDIVGNVWEFIDFQIANSVYTHSKKSRINDSDGITAADTTITVDSMEYGDTWPSSGLVKIDSEYITYATINYQGSGKAVLSNCTRGAKSSTAATHADNAIVEQLTDYCIIPGGATAYISDASGITASGTSITYTGLVNGPGNSGFAAGDILQCEAEQMTVVAVNSNVLTVTRGANGSTAATHATGAAFTKLSTQMTNVAATQSAEAYQFGFFSTMRGEQDLATLCLPYTAGTGQDMNGDWNGGIWLRNAGNRVGMRGGYWGHSNASNNGGTLYLTRAVTEYDVAFGFRAALTLDTF